MDADGVRELLKIKMERAGFKTEEQAAWVIGISRQSLSQVIAGTNNPGPRLLRWMGLKRVPQYAYLPLTVLNSDRYAEESNE